MKRLVLWMCLFLLFASAGCAPKSVTVSDYTALGKEEFVISDQKELKFLDRVSKLQYNHNNADSCQYSFEWKGSLYEITLANTRVLIKKGESSAIMDDPYDVNLMYTMLGLQPSGTTAEYLQFADNEVVHEVVLTDLKTNEAISIPKQYSESIVRSIRSKDMRIVDLDIEYYREKQASLESGNQLLFNLAFYNMYGELQLTFDVYHDAYLAEYEGRLVKSKDSLVWVYNSSAIKEEAEKWVYDAENYVVRGQEYSLYPLEINVVVVKDYDGEANYPVYLMEVINHSDKELILFKAYTEIGSNDYLMNRQIHLQPNETKTVLASTGYGHMGNYTYEGSDTLNYVYYDVEDNHVYRMEHGLKSKENKDNYKYMYDFGLLKESASYVYYVDFENETYGVIEGFDLPKDELESYWWEKPSTILDYLLREGYRTINFVETEVKLTDELKDEIQTLADELEVEVIFDFCYTVENYAEMKDKNGLMSAATIVKATDGSDQLWVSECSTPMIITKQDRTNALAQNLPLSELPGQHRGKTGRVGGINRILPCDEQDKLEEYFRDALNDSYYYISFLGEEELGAMKPVIYLYNDEDIQVHVDTEKPTTLTYPEIEDGWDVELKDNHMYVDGKEIRALYYEAMIPNVFDTSKGFVVHKNEAAAFLEEKLAYMGLNELEIYDFIVFWLPYFHENEYTLVSFQNDVYASLYPLKTSVQPDTEIRIYMVIQGLDHKIEVPAQQLEKGVERKGLTLVEWGGSVLDSSWKE